jgi:large repetitive protein
MTSNPAQISQPVAIRAAVLPAGTGTVDFTNGAAAIAGCTGVPLQNGVAVCNTSFPQIGTLTIGARYSGDSNTQPVTGSMQLEVGKVVAGTYLASAPPAPVCGELITFNVLLLGASGVAVPTGAVTVSDGTSTLGSENVDRDGRATIKATLSPGTHSIVATYNGDGNYQKSTAAPLMVTVSKVATTLVLAASPAQIGQPVELKATPVVSRPGCQIGGAITFTSVGTAIAGCSALPTQNGSAFCNTRFSQLGTFPISAAYSGDANTTPSTASLQLTVGKLLAGTYAAFTPPRPLYGLNITVGALLLGAEGSPAPTGTITFSEGATVLASLPVDADGRASLTRPMTVGSHRITVAYSGDANYQTGAASPLNIVVARASTTVVLASTNAQIGQPATVKATVKVREVGPGTGTPAGSLDFLNGGKPITGCSGLPLQDGVAFCNTQLTQFGGYSITANYSGDQNLEPGSGTMDLTVGKAVAGIYTASSPSAPVFGTPVTVGALLLGATGLPLPMGTVTFSEGAARLSVPIGSDGRASVVLPALSAGQHTIATSYSGDANYASSTAPPLTIAVVKGGTTTSLTASFGSPFLATVTPVPQGTGTPTGSVEFIRGGLSIGFAPLAQQGSNFTATLPAGNYSGNIWASYRGDANFNGSLSPAVTITAGVRITIAADPNPAIAGQAVVFKIRVAATSGSGTPTGTVQLSDSGASLGTAAVEAGQATFTTALPVGTHEITATYSGDSVYPSGTATYSQLVAKSVTPLSLTSSASATVYGETVTFRAQLATPGSVQFFDAGSAIGSAQAADGVASLSLSNLSAGSHSITAAWPGDANAAAAVSAPLPHTVDRAQTSTALTPRGLTLEAGIAVIAPGAGVPTGTVSFADAATNLILATAVLSDGRAAVPLTSGTAPILAVYSGDTNFQSSASRVLIPLVAVSAASYSASGFAPDEIVTLFGPDLQDAAVTVTDSKGDQRDAHVQFTSAAQLSFVIPGETAMGRATVTATSPNRPVITTEILIVPVAPGLFALDGSGQGTPAGQIISVHADGTQDAPQQIALPVDLGLPTDTVYLVLFGTGFRHSTAPPVCMADTDPVPVAFAGAQGSFTGLDQINLVIPQSFRGKTVDLQLTVDGAASNTVTLTFR